VRFAYIAMIVVLIAGSLLAIGLGRSQADARERTLSVTTTAVSRMNREIRVQSAMGGAELNGRGWPITIDPAWFGRDLPRNLLVDPTIPWLEVASDSELELDHPATRLVTSRADAAFWYNPAKGIVRGRVGAFVSDAQALDAYNRINGSALRSLFGDGHSPAPRRP
jgi:type II secretory pathway pseudopilin PulG